MGVDFHKVCKCGSHHSQYFVSTGERFCRGCGELLSVNGVFQSSSPYHGMTMEGGVMALKYRGPLFGQIGRRHIPLEMHSDDVGAMERELASLRSALAEKTALSLKISAQVEMLEERIAELEAEVERYRATVEEVARQRNEAREQVERLEKRIADLEAEVAAPILTSVNRLADQLADERVKVERLREAHVKIRVAYLNRDWVENSLDPQWAASISTEALDATDDTPEGRV